MIEVYKNLFVGSEADYKQDPDSFDSWYVVHACKEPFHRNALGYKERSAPKNSPFYLFLYDSKHHLILNIVDAPNPRFFSDEMIDEAINYCIKGLNDGHKVFVHCNQGESRAPTIALMVLRKLGIVSQSFEDAVNSFSSIYSCYKPNKGIFEYARKRWDRL